MPESINHRKCSQKSLLDSIQETNANGGRFCFILGSGASKESGIKTGQDMQKEWLEKIKEDGKKDKKDYILNKIAEIGCITLDVDEVLSDDYSYQAKDYFPLFSIRFFPNEKNGYRYLEKELERANASFGYYPLARILTESPNNVVITLNFDSLLEDSLFMYTTKKPLVVVHESLVKHIDLNQNRPIIAKIHRSLYFSPCNSKEDTNCLKEEWKESLKTIFNLYTPIIIGYGGGDASLMTFLKEMEPCSNGLYWCHMPETDLTGDIQDIITKHSGSSVRIAGFDDCMYHLGQVMGYNKEMPNNATKTLEDTAKIRADRFTKSFLEFDAKYKDIDSLPIEKRQTADLLTENEKTYKDLLTKNISENAHDPQNYFYRGNIYYNQKDYKNALADYDSAIKLDPKYVSAYNNRGATYDNLKDYKNALADYDSAIKLDPKYASAYNNRGNTYADLKDYDKALADYDSAIKLDPKYASAYNNRGNTYADLKDYDRAFADIENALKIDEEAVYYDSLAKIYNDIGRYDTAIVNCKKALALDSTICEPHENLAYALFKKGQFLEALASCNRAIECNPVTDSAQKLLKDITKAIEGV